ncbi:MAG TPA: SRPBCC domain-containing protein [Aggregatilineales bacterium]|nr:SRPBCC domain-containing protein [Aggregatilineales bacterium]
MSENKDYSVTFLVDRTPKEAFDAITNVRGWWSEEIEGDTDRLGAEFKYHYQDVHRCTFKITELVPEEKVVWHCLDNYFNFIKDKTEWIGTDVVFEIARKGDKTEVHFTHVGLVPAYECYDVCSNAWGSYITKSLRDLITTGKGQPNPIEEVVNKAHQMSAKNYSTSFTVDQTPEAVFAAVNNVRGWWSEEIVGDTDRLGGEFYVQFEDVHRSTQKITEWVPGQKVVWHVVDSQLNFVKDKSEWTGTDIVFEIARAGDRTELRFTHVGLIRAFECYGDCSEAWGLYINQSLFALITTGKGEPNPKDKAAQAQSVER